MSRRKKHEISFLPFIFYLQRERPIDWNKEFGRKAPLDVEIGSGLGEFLVQTSKQHPERNFVGIELEWGRVRKFLRKIELKIAASNDEDVVNNIRVLRVDAVVAFERLFAPRTIHNIYCLFPCPWPKKRHIKHRIFSHEFLRLVNSRLVDRAGIKIVTDFKPYYEWTKEQLHDTGFKKNEKIIRPQFNTKYERKWCEQGQNEFYELHLIKNKHITVPLKKDVALQVYFAKKFKAEKFSLDDITGEVTVVLKDFLFDATQKKGLVYLIVSEKNITQHMRVSITKCSKGWRVEKAEGDMSLPTSGLALALKRVCEAVENTAKT